MKVYSQKAHKAETLGKNQKLQAPYLIAQGDLHDQWVQNILKQTEAR